MIPTSIGNCWLSLGVAIFFGTLGTISLKLSHGLKKWWAVFCVMVFYGLSFAALTFAVKHIDLSIVYAVWSGIGTLFMSIIGILFFHEALSVKRTIYLVCIIVGVVGIHLSSNVS